MKKLFLHIGLGKTGSSALQSWLSLNSEALSRQGVDYADLVPQAKQGEVSSGNGYALHKACVSQNFEEVERLLTSTYFFNPRNNVALISCELFQGLRIPLLQKIHDICAKCNIDVTVIVYVRSVYEQLYSTYLQGIKRAAIAHRFGEDSSDIGLSKSMEYLTRHVKVFGDRVIAVNYDEAKADIYASIAEIIGVKNRGFEDLKKKVNRSLTLEEAEVLRRMNGLHGGVFATHISDFVISLSPNVDTPVFYDADLVRKVREATEDDLRWVNEQFEIPTPVVSDFYDGHSHTKPVTLTRESYQPVIRWALDFDSGPTLRRKFATFLNDLAVFIMDISADDATALKNKLKAVQSQLAREPELPEVSEPVQAAAGIKAPKAGQVKPTAVPVEKQKQRYPSHLITYFYDTETLNSEEAIKIDSRFNEWLTSLAKHAVGGILNPIKNTHVLRGDNLVSIHKKSAMTGYTLVQIQDTDTLLALARKCPLLEVGGVLEVSRVVNLLAEAQKPVRLGKDSH